MTADRGRTPEPAPSRDAGAAARAAAGPGAGPGAAAEAFDEATVVVPARTQDDDATVVRAGADPLVDEATLVRPHIVEDATTVVRRHADEETVAYRSGAEDGRGTASGGDPRRSRWGHDGARRGDPAPPIPAPDPVGEAPAGAPQSNAALSNAAPSSASLSRASARVYGARPIGASAPQHPDEVLRRIGPPPAAEPRYAADRPRLPSLARRFRRERAITLACYAGVVVISIAGLTVISRIAFG